MSKHCQTCGKDYSPTCDWRQGRCPNHPSLAEQILADPYKARYLNLFNSIKNIFKRK